MLARFAKMNPGRPRGVDGTVDDCGEPRVERYQRMTSLVGMVGNRMVRSGGIKNALKDESEALVSILLQREREKQRMKETENG